MQDVLADLCADYLTRLREALSSIEQSDREQIVDQVTEHLHEAVAALPSPSEDGMREILERLGSPEEIAAAAAPDQSEHRSRNTVTWLGVTTGDLVVAIAFGIAALTGAFGGGFGPSGKQTSTVTFVVVPNVVGIAPAKAAGTLQQAGMYNSIDDLNCLSIISRGRTVAESPPPGSKVARGTRISIQVACRGQ